MAWHLLASSEVEKHMPSAAEIMKLEKKFWQAMVDQHPEEAAKLLTDEAANAAMFGIHHFSPDEYLEMAKQGPAKLKSFTFSDEKVIFPAPNVAVATYEANQTFEMDGKVHEMVCFDTTTWVERDGKWLAAVHTETEKKSPPPA